MSPTLPPSSISAAKSSRLESLPPEIFVKIMEELLTLSKNKGFMGTRFIGTHSMGTRAPKAKWPRRYGFFPGIQPQVLRLSKNIHALASDILDHSNKWVIFDMDCAHLLIAWAAVNIGMIIVDPESAQALPSGMMHARVKLYTQTSVSAHILNSCWPTVLLKRQVILIPASKVESFLEGLRKVKLANAVRVMPGKTFRDYPSRAKRIAATGVHGLSLHIHVNPEYAEKIISTTLEEFRILHGPLNEVSIVGAPNEHQARRIEASITAPRDAARESTFSEALMHALELLHLADLRSKDNLVHPVSMLGRWRVTPINEVRLMYITQSTRSLVNQDGLEPELKAYLLLFGGLHCIFSCHVIGKRAPVMGVVRHGMNLINETKFLITQMPRKDTIFFRAAYKMHEMISRLDTGSDTTAIANVVKGFKKWFSKHLKPIKWRVHEGFISQTLRDRGVLGNLWKMGKSTLKGREKLDRYHIINTFEVEEGTKGKYYLL